MTALKWLKKFNIQSGHIQILESNFDWMEGKDEAELLPQIDSYSEDDELEEDEGPSPEQFLPFVDDIGESYAFTDEINQSLPKQKDDNITKMCEKAKNKGNKSAIPTISFPYVSPEPIDEFDSNLKIFALAFPWLYPGGIGDCNDQVTKKQPLKQILTQQLEYFDGRFAKDRLWCFYSYNYLQRHMNQTSGGYFVNKFYENCPGTAAELQNEIKKGNFSCINHLTYYSNRILGSPSFWRSQRNKANSWISHHVEEGNGAPSLFLTLSCAEYQWPDIKRLLRDRFTCIGLQPPNLEEGFTNVVNEYTLIIQQYFQQRVECWLETVGKNIFRITHYWGRYEFAKSRGQIHMHLLGICENKHIYNALFQNRRDKKKQASILQQYLQNQFRTTASFQNNDDAKKCDSNEQSDKENHPATKYYSDVCHNLPKDCTDCCLYMQCHKCSKYCLRKRKYFSKSEDKNSRKRRKCRMGFGIEITANSNVTKGMPLRSMSLLETDPRGFDTIRLPRNSTTLVQTSLWLAQSWRANCDVQFIIYDSDPNCPDPREIAQVTDYIVAYQLKGNSSLREEREQIRQKIRESKEQTDSAKIVRQLLNATSSQRLISKQEVMVLLDQLPLITSTELIQDVSLTGSYKIGSGFKSKTLIYKYSIRNSSTHHNQSFHEFVCKEINKNRRKKERKVVPNYTGGQSQPTFPVTENFARSILLIHKPWHKKFDDSKERQFIPEFYNFLNSTICPPTVKIAFERAKENHKKKLIEPTSNIEEYRDANLPTEFEEYVKTVSTTEFWESIKSDDDDCNYGEDFDWSKVKTVNKMSKKEAGNWLIRRIDEENHKASNVLHIPKKLDGTKFKIEDCSEDQKDIIAVLLKTLKELVDYALGDSETKPTKNQILMTIRGAAGSGKTTLINTLVTILHKMFPDDETTITAAPTGASAFNAGNGATTNKTWNMTKK